MTRISFFIRAIRDSPLFRAVRAVRAVRDSFPPRNYNAAGENTQFATIGVNNPLYDRVRF
jgi:hypothetical protein